MNALDRLSLHNEVLIVAAIYWFVYAGRGIKSAIKEELWLTLWLLKSVVWLQCYITLRTLNICTMTKLLVFSTSSSRVFLGAAGQFWEVSQQHVHSDIRETLHAELRGVPGPVHGAKALLHGGQRQPGGDAERLLVPTARAHVPAA